MAGSSRNNVVDHESSTPVIDYSMLVSDDPDQRSEVVRKLAKACTRHGYFMVIKHGVPEELFRGIKDAFFEFFDLPEKEKKIYETNDAGDSIRWREEKNKLVSREFLKFSSNPSLCCPTKPLMLMKAMREYNERAREVGIEIVRGISESLGMERTYIEKAMKLEQGYDFYTANDYPSCKQSETPMGQLAHTDSGILVLLMQNVGGGLQVELDGEWVDANLQPNSFVVTISDHLEILTNGKYKSKVHRVVMNNDERRFTLPLFLGPALDAVVSPAPEFLGKFHRPAYRAMTYREYLEANEFHIIDGKSCLNQIRL